MKASIRSCRGLKIHVSVVRVRPSAPFLHVEVLNSTKSPKDSELAKHVGAWRQGKRSLRPDLDAKYWSFVTTNGYMPNHSDSVAGQRNTQPQLRNMVPRGGLEPPAHE